MSAMTEYREALKRLIDDKPLRVPKGSAINKDTVAMEAGRGRGSIKKNRPQNTELIAEIEAASASKQPKANSSKAALAEELSRRKVLKQRMSSAQDSLQAMAQRYISMVQQLADQKQQIRDLEGSTKNHNIDSAHK